jgi:hypothetical protein
LYPAVCITVPEMGVVAAPVLTACFRFGDEPAVYTGALTRISLYPHHLWEQFEHLMRI